MKHLTLLIFAFSFSISLQAQQLFTKKQLEVQKTVMQLFETLSNRDSVSMKSICTPDVTFFEYGQVWNIDTLIRKVITLNQSTDFKRTNAFEFISTTVDKSMSMVTYHLKSNIIKDGKLSTVQWLETVVLVKDKKRWKIKQLHSTLIKRT